MLSLKLPVLTLCINMYLQKNSNIWAIRFKSDIYNNNNKNYLNVDTRKPKN